MCPDRHLTVNLSFNLCVPANKLTDSQSKPVQMFKMLCIGVGAVDLLHMLSECLLPSAS